MGSNRGGLIAGLGLLVCLSTAGAVDFDGDYDADQADFGHFQVCLTGPGQSPSSDCHNADLDGEAMSINRTSPFSRPV